MFYRRVPFLFRGPVLTLSLVGDSIRKIFVSFYLLFIYKKREDKDKNRAIIISGIAEQFSL